MPPVQCTSHCQEWAGYDTVAVVGFRESAKRLHMTLNKNDVVQVVGPTLVVPDADFVNNLSLERDRGGVLVNSVECVLEVKDETRLVHHYRDPSSIPVRYVLRRGERMTHDFCAVKNHTKNEHSRNQPAACKEQADGECAWSDSKGV